MGVETVHRRAAHKKLKAWVPEMEIELVGPGMKTRKGNMAETGKDGV